MLGHRGSPVQDGDRPWWHAWIGGLSTTRHEGLGRHNSHKCITQGLERGDRREGNFER